MPRRNLVCLDPSNLQIPYHFRCPISLELMRDPVTVSTGQTYDRSSIESWVATGNTTCPVTRLPLSDFTLIPNHTLRRLIQDWCVANSSFGIQRIPTPKQPAEPGLVLSLLNQIMSDSNHSNLSAIRRLKALARDSDKNRATISAHNVTAILIDFIFAAAPDLDLTTHEAISLLVMFPLSELECVSIASNPARINCLASLLFNPSIEVRVNAAALIEIVIAGTKSTDLRGGISSVDEVFEGVIELLKKPISNYPRALKMGIKTLFALCLIKQTRQKAVVAGAAEALIDRLADFDKCEAERALATIELLCRVEEGVSEIAEHALSVPLLVKTILTISDRATEHAAGALLALCTASDKCQREAVSAGVLTQLLLVVQSDCTDRAKRKAQMLLKLLRDSWPQQHSSHDFLCTQLVHS